MSWISFLRGDQYAIALALLDEGKVVLGVLACPNLPLSSINNLNGNSLGDQVGALFSATIGCGAEVESLYGSPPQKVIALLFWSVVLSSKPTYLLSYYNI